MKLRSVLMQNDFPYAVLDDDVTPDQAQTIRSAMNKNDEERQAREGGPRNYFNVHTVNVIDAAGRNVP